MALSVGDRPIRPLTVDDIERMVEAGILGEDDRVELLHGVLTAMSPQDPPHAVVTQRLNRWLAPLMVAGAHDVRVQLPFRVPDRTSFPEPDFAVVARDDARIDHPRDALLVIEVADSSLRVDTRIKAPLYAAGGVPEYWVVDVAGRRVLIHTDPMPDDYATRRTATPGDHPAPSHVEIDPLDLDALLAGL